jgi:regulator of protease activity HflC (stomatin/prohibitin superfamily)
LFTVGCDRVEPGYVGIKVNQWGSQKGVNDFPIVTGGVIYNPFTEDIYKFPTFMQNAVWTKDSTDGSRGDDSVTFNSIEGAVINADIALAYTFVSDKVPQIFVEFRQEPSVITHGFMRNEINNAFNRIASTMKASDIFGEKKQNLLDSVKSVLNEQLGERGFKFELISFHGGLRVDNSVQSRINAVLEASQRAIEAETKVKQSKAEADQAIEKARGEKESNIAKAEGEARSISLKAEAQAKANLILSQSLTPALVQYEALQRWSGTLPSVLTLNGSQIPMIMSLTNLSK